MSCDGMIRDSVSRLLLGITPLLANREVQVTQEVIAHASMRARALTMLPRVRGMSMKEVFEMLSTVTPARHPVVNGFRLEGPSRARRSHIVRTPEC
jgi:hypothetical protein